MAGSTQLLLDPRRSVDATVLLEDGLDLSGQSGVLSRTLSRLILALPPVIVAASCHPQLTAQPGHPVLISELLDQAKPLGGSCSYRKRKPFELGPSALPPA